MHDEMNKHEAIERMKTLHAQLTAARESALICSALLAGVDQRSTWLRDDIAQSLEVLDSQVRGNIHSMQ
jgi:hypothetical protein